MLLKKPQSLSGRTVPSDGVCALVLSARNSTAPELMISPQQFHMWRNSMDLESPLGVFAVEDAQHIVLALGNPKRVAGQWG